MRHINRVTRQVVEQRPDRIGGTLNPTEDQYITAGWRSIVEAAPVADGYRRISETLVDNEDGATFRVDVVDRLVTDIEAEEKAAAEAAAARAAIDAEKAAAAQAAYLAGVDVLPRPLQGRFETPAADGHVYGMEVDPSGDEIIPVQRESTRLTQAEYDAAKAAKLAARAAHRDAIRAIKADLDQVETALDQVDVTTTGPLGVAIAATTGNTKTALTETRKVLVDLKAAAKNLRQAVEKVRREIR